MAHCWHMGIQTAVELVCVGALFSERIMQNFLATEVSLYWCKQVR